MLRQTFLAAALAAIPLTSALADNDVGCGAGTILWEGQSGVPAKVLAATTNGSFGNQTFGISSGTLECQQGGVITVSARIPVYASANLDRLAADMAAGQGEALSTLAELYGIQADQRADFYRLTRDNFARLFPRDDTTAGDMLQALQQLMARDPQLRSYVS